MQWMDRHTDNPNMLLRKKVQLSDCKKKNAVFSRLESNPFHTLVKLNIVLYTALSCKEIEAY